MSTQTKIYDARVIANKFLDLADESGNGGLTPLQVGKLVYFAHGWTLGLYDRPLIEQYVEAWKYGPAIADVFHGLKKYEDGVVEGRIVDIWNRPYTDLVLDQDMSTIEEVYQAYGHISGEGLLIMTHREGTPWDKVDRNLHAYVRNLTIPNGIIRDYFAGLLVSEYPEQVA